MKRTTSAAVAETPPAGQAERGAQAQVGAGTGASPCSP
ncbi:hypothetical protein J2S68_001874 [Glycomyces algeriensis]|nr:hypothetical protein [Glycomyces algeriensis]